MGEQPRNTKEQERPSSFGFYSPRWVVDQSDPNRRNQVAAPESVDGWVEWFQKHPNLTTEEDTVEWENSS